MPDEDIRQMCTQVKKGEIARYILLPGDPGRVKRIASLWDEDEKIVSSREFTTYSGKVGGVKISATSTGIGGPSAAVAIEELSRVGADTFIRVGSSGCMGNDVLPGDLIITSGAIRREGTSRSYVGIEYPAVAHYEIVSALIQSATEFGYPFHVGITLSVDGFYSSNKLISGNELKSMSTGGYFQSWMEHEMLDAKRAGALNQEMEAGTILTLCNLFGLRGGVVCAATDRIPWDSPSGIDFGSSEEKSIRVAIEAVKLLAKWDKDKEEQGVKYWHPGMIKE